MSEYFHKVQYYETDKMQITHHSNYLRFMEEARMDFLEKLGLGYRELEKAGVACPVIGVEAEYKKPTTFGDVIKIEVKTAEFSSVKATLEYEMTVNGETVCRGKSRHCSVGGDGRPILLKRLHPEIYEKLLSTLEKD